MDPNCLTRRSVPDESQPTAADVALWTNHRVMEWLRIVDLAEYAPNLRGSGMNLLKILLIINGKILESFAEIIFECRKFLWIENFDGFHA